MKIKLLLFILVLLTNLYAQVNPDTLKTLPVISDSLRQDSTAADTTALLSDSLKISKKDSLAAIHQSPFYPGSFFISNREMMFTDYRYAADFLELFPSTFVLDKGFIGQPSELLIYGAGFNSISYFQDGILINTRSSNSLDLNNIQSESVDSIEIIPAPRGFLYGPVSNLVSVNFLTKDFIPRVPYSRIKYYEGPSGEAMFDGIFSAMLFKKLSFYADITNRKTEENQGFDNSGFGTWQTTAKFKYFISDKINVGGTYNFVNSETGINGGVDVDSIRRITLNVDSILYNENLAPVVQPNALQKIKQHHFGLRMLWNTDENFKTDLNLYYKFYLDEISNSDYKFYLNQIPATGSYNANQKSKILGAALKEVFNLGIFSSQINFNYEYNDFIYGDRVANDSLNIRLQTPLYYNVFSVSPILSINALDSGLVFSLFYKYSKSDKVNSYTMSLNGAGADVYYMFNNETKLYLGYSRFQALSIGQNIQTIEAGANYSRKNLLIDVKYYTRKNFYSGISAFPNSNGIGIKFDFSLWKLQVESLMNIPDKENYYNQFFLRGGLYYNDVLFDSGLVLKTGFALYHFSRLELVTPPPDKTGISRPRIDFTLSGEIQKSAIVYFAWENLLGEEYFIVPYYPMPGRSIRFGIAWEIFN